MSIDSRIHKSRRQLLASIATAISLSVAGCSGTLKESNINKDVTYPPNSVSEGAWVSVDTSSRKLEFTGLDGYAATRLYQNTKLQKSIQRRFAGEFTKPLALGFASRIKYHGVSSTGVTAGKIYDEARPEFVNRLKSEGLQDISELASSDSKSDNRPDPKTKATRGDKYSEFIATYLVPKKTPTLNVSEYGKQSFQFDKRRLNMRALLFVMDTTLAGTEGTAYVLGGAYPEENYRNRDSVSLASNDGASLNLTVSLNAGLNSRAIRRRLVNEFITPIMQEVENEN